MIEKGSDSNNKYNFCLMITSTGWSAKKREQSNYFSFTSLYSHENLLQIKLWAKFCETHCHKLCDSLFFFFYHKMESKVC